MTPDQLHLIEAAQRGALEVSAASRFRIAGVEIDAQLGWVASDMLTAGLLYLPAVTHRSKYRPVHPATRAVAHPTTACEEL